MKFVLIVIVMAADMNGYADFVDKPVDTAQECELRKSDFMKKIRQHFDKSHYYFAVCAPMRGMHAVDV